MQKINRTIGFILKHPLGKKHPLTSLLRLLAWQLQSMFSPSKLIVKSFISPVKFYARKGLTGITGNIYAGLHEFDDMAFLLHFLRIDDVFFDIGANVGSYTLLASGVCKSSTTAIEPAKLTFNLLCKNVQLNSLQNKVTLINAVAGGLASSSVVFSQNEDTTNHVIANDESATGIMTVPVITLDSLLKTAAPALIKIDVEGYETEVLKGMAKTLRHPNLKAIIIELNGSGVRYGFDENKIHELLLLNGFIPYNYNAFKRKLNAIEYHGSHNTIYCRDIDFINERIKNARPVKVMGESI
jgi:FkbM family methyltransferase